ncbi:MAG TPA: caspase family protein, partial [Accumulibacter sp.]|nr:caspase family protein [Accumulibacter sp.]
MITRRRFITSLAALTSAPAIDTPWASTRDSSKVALIIGNSAYPNMRLLNPANDARAMSELLGSAGFSVDTRLDATRLDLLAAIERFGDTARQSATELALFYYAGHGAQLDWRNYLLPVDARIASAEQLKQNGIDLGLLLNKLKAASGKSFVIVLDACRDDPFGSAFRTAQKGLSQFDAPVGSLLAYSTSPGNTASDGDGKNGLYTEHLVRELSAGGIRIEDALKRVRLNVRLASNGGQIPWESTSLENDIYIVGTGPKKRSDAELEKEIEDDLRDWERIKTSHDIDDWATYIRKRPNGRFAEIAQSRLIKLMARRQTAPVAS